LTCPFLFSSSRQIVLIGRFSQTAQNEASLRFLSYLEGTSTRSVCRITRLTKMNEYDYRTCINFESVNLRYNVITNIHEKAFEKLKELRTPDLSCNRTTILPSHLCEYNSKLETLLLRGNLLSVMGPIVNLRFEVFTAVTTKNGVFWDVTPCGSCKNRCFGGTWRLFHQGDKNR
jgi:hypothetical protein